MILTGSIVDGSPVVSDITDTTGLLADMYVEGADIPPGTRIATVDSGTQITLNQAATTTDGAASLTIYSTFTATSRMAAAVSAALTSSLIQLGGKVLVAVNTSANTLELDSKLSGSVSMGVNAGGALSVSRGFSASVSVKAFGNASLSDSAVPLSGRANVGVNAEAVLTSFVNFAAAVILRAEDSAKISADIVLRGATHVNATASATVSLVGEGLGVCSVINDILLLWGIEDARMSVQYLRDRALHDLNAAMQLIWARAKDRDYFSRRTLTVILNSGTSSAVLEQDVQNVLGPVRRDSDKGNLRPLASRSQLDLFGHLFLGQTNNAAVVNGVPQAFFAERLNQSRPDNTKIVLHVVPAPDADTNLLVDVAMECPRYEWRDYCQCTPLHIPHRYAESVLLPVCRHRAMSSHYFIKEDRRELIENEYAVAMQVLGLVDPQLKEADASKGASA